MFYLLKLAAKNVTRNRKRSVITFGAVAVGLLFMVFGLGLMLGIGKQSERNLIDMETGHIKLFAPGYWENRNQEPLAYVLDDVDSLFVALQNIPGVQGVTPRIVFPAFLNDGINDFPCLGIGMDLTQEGEGVFRLRESVVQGSYLSLEEDGILVGQGVAEVFEKGVGDFLTVLARTRYDAIQAYDLPIVGILRTGNPNIDRNAFYVSLALAQALLDMGGEATEIAVRLDRGERLDGVVARIEQRLKQDGLAGSIFSWRKLAEDFLKFKAVKEGGMGVMVAILVFLTAVGIANTMVMASFERTREIGMMMGLGMKASQVRWMFLLEGGLLGAVGGGLGCILGGALTYYFQVYGISIAMYGNMDIGYPVRDAMYTQLSTVVVLGSFLFGILVSVVASLYPAWRASRLEPVEALRYA